MSGYERQYRAADHVYRSLRNVVETIATEVYHANIEKVDEWIFSATWGFLGDRSQVMKAHFFGASHLGEDLRPHGSGVEAA